jgi:hypothetical protein
MTEVAVFIIVTIAMSAAWCIGYHAGRASAFRQLRPN